MTGKRIALAVFVLLLAVWWWTSLKQNAEEVHDRSQPMLGLNAEDVHSLRIQLRDETIVLRRNGTYWTLPDWNNYPADQTYADHLFRTLLSTPWGDVVSENPKKYDEYGLSPAKRRVDLFDAEGNTVGSILVGDHVDGYRTAFVRLPDHPEVRRVEADLVPSLSRASWARRSAWRLSESLILSVATTGFSRNFVATREQDNPWRLVEPDGQTLNEHFFAKLLPFLVHPKAGNVAFQTGSFFPVHASLRIKTSLTEMILELGDLDGEVILGRYGYEPVVYEFSPKIRELVENATSEPSGDLK